MTAARPLPRSLVGARERGGVGAFEGENRYECSNRKYTRM